MSNETKLKDKKQDYKKYLSKKVYKGKDGTPTIDFTVEDAHKMIDYLKEIKELDKEKTAKDVAECKANPRVKFIYEVVTRLNNFKNETDDDKWINCAIIEQYLSDQETLDEDEILKLSDSVLFPFVVEAVDNESKI